MDGWQQGLRRRSMADVLGIAISPPTRRRSSIGSCVPTERFDQCQNPPVAWRLWGRTTPLFVRKPVHIIGQEGPAGRVAGRSAVRNHKRAIVHPPNFPRPCADAPMGYFFYVANAHNAPSDLSFGRAFTVRMQVHLMTETLHVRQLPVSPSPKRSAIVGRIRAPSLTTRTQYDCPQTSGSTAVANAPTRRVPGSAGG
jgi:hypothetical protein